MTIAPDNTPAFNDAAKSPKQLGEELVKALSPRHCDPDRALVLVKLGADLTVTNGKLQDTPLHLAVMRGFNGVVAEILDRGADTEAEDVFGNTALHWACWDKNAGAARLLIAAKADIEKLNTNDQTPLMLATRFSCIDIMTALLDAGAKVNVLNKHGRSALDFAQRNGNPKAIALLEKAGGEDYSIRMNRTIAERLAREKAEREKTAEPAKKGGLLWRLWKKKKPGNDL